LTFNTWDALRRSFEKESGNCSIGRRGSGEMKWKKEGREEKTRGGEEEKEWKEVIESRIGGN